MFGSIIRMESDEDLLVPTGFKLSFRQAQN
jgi:hypothetical protein